MMDIVQSVTTLPETIRFGGHTITAPGFAVETFAAAIDRALADGLTISPGRPPRTWLVTNPTNRSEYIVSPFGCSCRAGELNRPCKHRSLVLLIEAIIGGSGCPGGVA